MPVADSALPQCVRSAPTWHSPALTGTIRFVVPWHALLVAAGAVILALAGTGCSSYVKRGCSLYTEGRYVEAAEVFERTEHRLRNSTPRQQAEYGLYRGLTLLALGDVRNAHRWMAYAYEVERWRPGALRPNRRGLLDRGWFELGRRLNAAPPQPAQPGTALAASQPPQPAPPPQPALRPAEGGTRSSLVR